MSALFDDTELEPSRAEVERDLPELRGTPKQTPWAGKIRSEKLGEIDRLFRDWLRLIENHTAGGRPQQADQEREAYHEAFLGLERLEKERSAGWWISHRDNTARELLSGAEARPGNQGFYRREE